MSSSKMDESCGPVMIDRRHWLRRVATAGAVFGCLDDIAKPRSAAQPPALTPKAEAEQELERAQAAVRSVTRRPLVTMRSEQFQAVGDAAEVFLKVTLDDCETVAKTFSLITRPGGSTSSGRDAG